MINKKLNYFRGKKRMYIIKFIKSKKKKKIFFLYYFSIKFKNYCSLISINNIKKYIYNYNNNKFLFFYNLLLALIFIILKHIIF